MRIELADCRGRRAQIRAIVDKMEANPINQLFARLWADYVANTAQPQRIHKLLAGRGEQVFNDHIALRSIASFGAQRGVGIADLAKPFIALGFVAQDSYAFPQKHLRACYYQHADAAFPKVFVSELLVSELSSAAQATLAGLLQQLAPDFATRADLPWAGRPWALSHATYLELLAESEYAAWVAAFGFRVNHFTIDVNRLRTFAELNEVNAFVQDHGFVLNAAGGVIKGNPAERLEQSSTMADAVDVAFTDGTFAIPSCYYEFAKRYPLPDGTLFQGFVPASADRIFESTDRR
jgi:Domain of unknown function (DUF1338)